MVRQKPLDKIYNCSKQNNYLSMVLEFPKGSLLGLGFGLTNVLHGLNWFKTNNNGLAMRA